MATSTKVDKEVTVAAEILMYMSEAEIEEEELQMLANLFKFRKRKPEEAHKNKINKAKKQNTTRTCSSEDKELFTEETLKLIENWKQNEPDPQRDIFGGVQVAEEFSKPMKKQVMRSDIKKDQSRLLLLKQQVEKTMLPMLEKSEDPSSKDGLGVSVYGPDGKAQEMKFKFWNGAKTPVLTTGWKEFVAKYGLEMHSDFLNIWMFRHITTRKICFAIDLARFDLKEKQEEDGEED